MLRLMLMGCIWGQLFSRLNQPELVDASSLVVDLGMFGT